MVDQIKGFITADGEFFKDKIDAELHEATELLRESYDTSLQSRADFASFRISITYMPELVINFCQAYIARKARDNGDNTIVEELDLGKLPERDSIEEQDEEHVSVSGIRGSPSQDDNTGMQDIQEAQES